MSRLESWVGTERLPVGQTLLLEASAGTGKTWQIAHIVCRLVAEEDVPIDRILVITYTNAAATELRGRIRGRLYDVRVALEGTCEPSEPLLAKLWAPAARRDERRRRVARALAEFDRASISTIHGFSQRTLSELAFESGQEQGLELLADPTPIFQELVADELARLYARASEADVACLADMGWTPASLPKVAKLVCGPIAPALEPSVAPDAPEALDPLEAVEGWRENVEQALSWWTGPEAEAACAGFLEGYRQRQTPGTKAKRDYFSPLKGTETKGMKVRGWIGQLRDWLAGGALRAAEPKMGGKSYRQLVGSLASECGTPPWNKRATEVEKTEIGRHAQVLHQHLEPLLATQDKHWPRALAGFAARARAVVERELERKGVLTYDTMLSRLAEALAEGGPKGPLACALRDRFDVALVDEFQDTDNAQWPVLETVFAHPTHRLLLIGDPKQAIYGFRHADLKVYLAAARGSNRFTMRCNYRSDGPYVAALNHLWQEGSRGFELPEVDYVTVEAHQQSARVEQLPPVDGRPRRPLELRWTDAAALDSAGASITNKGDAAALLAKLCAQEAHRLLTSGATLQHAPDQTPKPAPEPVAPEHIAVLVRTNWQGTLVREQLAALAIPAVSASRNSIFASPALQWLVAWLDAVADPGRTAPARVLVTTPLFGWTLHDLVRALTRANAEARGELLLEDLPAVAGDKLAPLLVWDRWLETLAGWAHRWPTQGFLRVFDAALDEYGVLQRVLGIPQGERHATDLRHLCELAHAYERGHRCSPAGLATWLRSRAAAAAAAKDSDADRESNQRLESDDEAVRIVTVHSAKGLQYPIVLLPFGWEPSGFKDDGTPLLLHATDGGPLLDMRVKGSPGRADSVATLEAEQRQEDARLLYVALTRAAHATVAWLGPLGNDLKDQDRSALGCLALRPRDEQGGVLAPRSGITIVSAASKKTPATRAAAREEEAKARALALERLERLSATSGGSIGWSLARPPARLEPLGAETQEALGLSVRPWPRERDLGSPWQVASYSSMVAGRKHTPEQTPDSEHRGLSDAQLKAEQAAEDEANEETDGARGRLSGAADATSALEDVTEDSLANVGAPPSQPGPESGAELDTPIPWAKLYGGKDTGLWVHEVFELLDFATAGAKDGTPLPALVANTGARHGVRDKGQHELVCAAMGDLLATPLEGGVTALPKGFALRDIERNNRLDELPFDLKLGEGNRWRAKSDHTKCVNAKAARRVLARRRGDPGWGGDAWLQALLERRGELAPVLPRVAGILTGFIDLVFRVPAPDDGGATGGQHPWRYFVADYKTNRIVHPNARRESLLGHYTQPWMAWEMGRHGYHLQALLYTVALHRLLRQRLGKTRYRPEFHLGGHLYLFLRGMCGASTPRSEGTALGVYADRWPTAVVLGLDAALKGQRTRAVEAIMEPAAQQGGKP